MDKNSTLETTVFRLCSPLMPNCFASSNLALDSFREIFHTLRGVNHTPCAIGAKYPDDNGGFSVFLQFPEVIDDVETAKKICEPVVAKVINEGGGVCVGMAHPGPDEVLPSFHCVEDDFGHHHTNFDRNQITMDN